MDMHINEKNYENMPLTLNKDYYLYNNKRQKHPILQLFEIAAKKKK